MTSPTRTIAATVLAVALLGTTSCSADGDDDGAAPTTSTTDDTATRTEPLPDTAQVTDVPDMTTWTPPIPPTGAEGQPRGLTVDPKAVDPHDVTQVARAFALTMLTPDSRLDITPSDVSRRAAQWAEPTYAERLSAPRASSGGAEWIALHADDGYWSAELTNTAAMENGDFDPAPSDLNAEQAFMATRTPHSIDGAQEETFAVVVYLTRTSPEAPWAVYEFYQEGDFE